MIPPINFEASQLQQEGFTASNSSSNAQFFLGHLVLCQC